MSRLPGALYRIFLTAWVGGLLAVGFLAAPLLFNRLSDRALAGSLAGEMFTIIAWVGLACGAYLLSYLLATGGWRSVKTLRFWLVAVMLALTAAGHFGIEPIMAQLKADALPRYVMESALRDRFVKWHGIASIIYVVQTLLGLWLAALPEQRTR